MANCIERSAPRLGVSILCCCRRRQEQARLNDAWLTPAGFPSRRFYFGGFGAGPQGRTCSSDAMALRLREERVLVDRRPVDGPPIPRTSRTFASAPWHEMR
jgi:hypothetical protein